jgi:ABC-type transport system substrate-binding protein
MRLVSLFVLGLGLAALVSAQPPRTETEDPKPMGMRKDVRMEETGSDLARLARSEKNPVIAKLFQDLAVPHETVLVRNRNRTLRIKPLPQYADQKPQGLPEPLTLVPIDPADGGPLEKIGPVNILKLRCYENQALFDVSQFLDKNPDILALERYQAAERVLEAVLGFHESQRQDGVRQGREWEPVRGELRDRLLAVRLDRLRELVRQHHWETGLFLARRLVEAYPNPQSPEQISAALLLLLDGALQDANYSADSKRELRVSLRLLFERFPTSKVMEPVATRLKEKALAEFRQAEEALARKDTKTAERLIHEIEITWPDLPELRTVTLSAVPATPTVLRVGVRELPKYLSPARAMTDTEKRAVDLLFEGLVKPVWDETGLLRYRPALSKERPLTVARGREFLLPRGLAWSDGKPLSAVDVRASVHLLREGKGVGRARAWGEFLEEVHVGGDPSRIDLLLRWGYPDPLSLMTFKIVPQDADDDSLEFATKPVGSGPYRLSEKPPEPGNPSVTFVANERYARPGNEGLPRIRTIVFQEYSDPARDFEQGKFDIALDLSAAQVAALQEKRKALSSKRSLHVNCPLPTEATSNRRVWFLAVNHRHAPLDLVELRQAIAHGINREALLDEHFRKGLGKAVHKPLVSPFPVRSWVDQEESRSGERRPLFDLQLSQTLFKTALAKKGPSGPLTLTHPVGDVVLRQAMEKLCEQLQTASDGALKVDRKELPLTDLLRDLETGSYDLAYCCYDYPDDTYWLGPLLAARGAGQENCLRYRSDTVEKLLQEAAHCRQFAQARDLTRTLRQKLAVEMPLVPLWQLDPLHAIHEDVRPIDLDPLRVFTSIERWALHRP